MLFQNENHFPKFENIKSLLDKLYDDFKQTELYGKEILVTGDITSAKFSKRKDLFIEISQKVKNTNYSITVFFPNGMVKYLFKNINIDETKDLINKRWNIKGKISLWKSSAKYVINGLSLSSLGDSEIELKRKKILKLLDSKNLLQKEEHNLDELEPIKKIAVITSPTAAGFGDFKKNLDDAKIKPLIHLYESPMQGASTVPGMKNALRNIIKSKIDYDLVVIIRGGGSKSDLMYFDDEEIGFYISKMNERIPVLSGIGHEQDKTIPDYVAWKSYSTPTEVSKDITNSINKKYENLELYSKNIYLYFSKLFSNMENNFSLKQISFLSSLITKKIGNNDNILKNYKNTVSREINIKINQKEDYLKSFRLSRIRRDLEKDLEQLKNEVIRYTKVNKINVNNYFERRDNFLKNIYQDITANSPFASFLNKGAIVKKDGKIIDSITKIQKDENVEVIFKDGKSNNKILNIEKWED
ncbi:exodeoxyribonuclease VII large subunit [Geotoga petraea]|uniref:Exodeoxyribonuclease 7 large subunit n=1 Tax=Geotoga petraea TaxID=28234 RepID=A0A1G6N4F6_9BACT|nr:exodeoxyribonuclease VII large subunit [Geotoga petraea]MDK2945533.1 exodeoxyribonuclease large subunit [Geotoga sp.]SDC62710.1 Exodeoxyribonuclease VII large subunit [Geotoga petraea]